MVIKVSSLLLHNSVIVATYGDNVSPVSGTSIIPLTNSAPLITEGTEIWTATVTPNSTLSRFYISFSALVGSDTNNQGISFTIFRGSQFITGSSVWADSLRPLNSTITALDVPGSIVPVTYSLRAGISSAAEWHIGQGHTFTMGGAVPSAWTIFEFAS